MIGRESAAFLNANEPQPDMPAPQTMRPVSYHGNQSQQMGGVPLVPPSYVPQPLHHGLPLGIQTYGPGSVSKGVYLNPWHYVPMGNQQPAYYPLPVIPQAQVTYPAHPNNSALLCGMGLQGQPDPSLVMQGEPIIPPSLSRKRPAQVTAETTAQEPVDLFETETVTSAPATVKPGFQRSKGTNLNKVQRLAVLTGDPCIVPGSVEPNRVQCVGCRKQISLGGLCDYKVQPWTIHREWCQVLNLKIKGIEVAPDVKLDRDDTSWKVTDNQPGGVLESYLLEELEEVAHLIGFPYSAPAFETK